MHGFNVFILTTKFSFIVDLKVNQITSIINLIWNKQQKY